MKKNLTVLLTWMIIITLFIGCSPATVEPTVEEPKQVETAVEEPTEEQPAAVEPTAEQPPTVEPTVEQPPTVEPTAEQPVVQEPVKLIFWMHDAGLKTTAMQEIINAYQVKYPNVTIEMQTFPYDEYWTKFTASIQAGSGPEIAYTYFGILPGWAKSGFIIPLADDLSAEIDQNDFPFAQITKFEGTQYGVLTSIRNFALFYNKDLLDEAGITEIPTTWDEFADAAQKCTKYDANGNIVQSGYFLGWESDGWNVWRAQVKSFGGEYVSEDGRQVLFNQGAAVDAWEYLLKFTTEYKTSTPSFFTSEKEAFMSGLSCFTFGLTALVAQFQEGMQPGTQWGTAAMPSGPAGSYTIGSTWPVVVTALAEKDPAKLEASMNFMRFVASEEGQMIYTSITKELPARMDMIDDPVYTEDPIFEPFLAGLDQTTNILEADEMAERQCAFDQYNAVIKAGEDPIQALNDGAACNQAIRDEFFK